MKPDLIYYHNSTPYEKILTSPPPPQKKKNLLNFPTQKPKNKKIYPIIFFHVFRVLIFGLLTYTTFYFKITAD